MAGRLQAAAQPASIRNKRRDVPRPPWAAPGASTPGTAGPRTGSGTRPAAGAASLVSVLPEVRHRELRQAAAEPPGAFAPAQGARRSRARSGAKAAVPQDGDSDFRPEPIRRRVMPGGSASIPLTELPSAPFVIRTDRAELVIQRITRSDLGGWASGMGRDRFGLWADFTIDDIRQRLRWCPPGRFLMGSPADEAGYVALKT